MIQAYKYRFYPTERQKEQLSMVFGHTRYVYNWALRLRTDAWHNGQRINYNQSSKALTELKKQETWLNDVSCVPLQQSLRHLQAAFSNFFAKRSRYPSFKKKRSRQSAEFTKSAFKWDGKDLSISKIGKLNIRWSRSFTSYPSTVTITKDSSERYFVSFKVDEPVKKVQPTRKEIGVDLGLKHLAILSNGTKYDNPRHLQKNLDRLATLQRRLSKKKKGSQNYKKARLKVARLHAKIADARQDAAHQISWRLVRDFDVIYLEDLNIKGMMKNRKLAKSISDASWNQFNNFIEYKAEWYGKQVVKIDRFYPSSKRCSSCGYIAEKMPLKVRNWTCPSCGAIHDRDTNAAKNIKAAGHAVLAFGESVRPKSSSGTSRRLSMN